MAQNVKNLFYIHDENLTSGSYYSPSDYKALSERSAGFAAGTTISSKNVNTALRQSSVFTVAFIDALLGLNTEYSSNVSPDGTLDSLTTFFTTVLQGIKVNASSTADSATTADKVGESFTFNINAATDSYDGSAYKSVEFFAPTTSGETSQVLTGGRQGGTAGAPQWTDLSTLTVGYAGDAEHADEADVAGVADKTGEKLSITLNSTAKLFDGSEAVFVQFYAPTTRGLPEQVLSSDNTGTPTWKFLSSLTVGSATNADSASTATKSEYLSVPGGGRCHITSITKSLSGSGHIDHTFGKNQKYLFYNVTFVGGAAGDVKIEQLQPSTSSNVGEYLKLSVTYSSGQATANFTLFCLEY